MYIYIYETLDCYDAYQNESLSKVRFSRSMTERRDCPAGLERGASCVPAPGAAPPLTPPPRRSRPPSDGPLARSRTFPSAQVLSPTPVD